MAESDEESIDNGLLWIIGAGIVAFAIIGFCYYRDSKSGEEYYRRNKQCYRELTLLITLSSTQETKWIENTILAEKSAVDGTNYCFILDLVGETGKENQLQGRDGLEKSMECSVDVIRGKDINNQEDYQWPKSRSISEWK
jgi:hypothetical protein